MWVRGLKLIRYHAHKYVLPSHPVWVRGLKQGPRATTSRGSYVAPRVGAWIETIFHWFCCAAILSHPVWVRGLKLRYITIYRDSNYVAPRVGAWIETFI